MPRSRFIVPVALVLALLLLLATTAAPAAADDDLRYRRTTPRAELNREGATLRLGIPGGRAWGVESGLLRVPRSGAAVTVRIEVADESVREAFARVAWYERAEGRPRQVAFDDSATVTVGPGETVAVALDPPDGAVAYRVRVLARLRAGRATSGRDAIRFAPPRVVRFGTPLTRLVPASP